MAQEYPLRYIFRDLQYTVSKTKKLERRPTNIAQEGSRNKRLNINQADS